ncbi:uncharacterized protein LOC106139693 [Amyelois transitella]|uniref:uncharacterized protein LOC106139693 n=1 Tax=Amyelois transitella TaxID=680683 RepID=UPI00067AB4C0|nr:uncharacterized protein LOC106139693 [Amyelois transitella]XP_060804226.1 uncharacterized protein LOC106139693 [Amyelois transitella]
MNFLSNVLDSIPVVGHVKGVVHYAVGDTQGGNKAMYQSTRTTAVLAGGAVGCVAGPAGAVAGAMSAGLATDTIASIATDKPQGIIEGCDNIGSDIAAGRNPTCSILSTTVQLGLDGVGGLGMGGVASAASNISEKAVAKTLENIGKNEMTKIVSKKVSEKAVQKAIQQAVVHAEVACVTAHIGLKASKRTTEEEKQEKQEQNEKVRKERYKREQSKERQASAGNQGTSTGSSQQPEGNGNGNNNNKNNKNKPDYLDIFMKLLKKLLKRIYGNEREYISGIFENLSLGQINYLRGIIEVTMKTGTLEEVVELVIRMFKGHMSKNVSFENFLSLLEFVRAYLLGEIDVRETESTRYNQETHDQRRAQILCDIMGERDTVETLVRLFRTLQAEIEAETAVPNNISPDFRDIFAAVYHYYKHRCVPEDGELSVKDYYNWIRKALEKLKKKTRYRQEVENQRGPVTCRYEYYVEVFGRRFRIVVKVRGGRLLLSSAFFVSICFEGDTDETENLKIEKK